MSSFSFNFQRHPAKNSVETLQGLSKIYEGFNTLNQKFSKTFLYFLLLALLIIITPVILLGLAIFYLWLVSGLNKSRKALKKISDSIEGPLNEVYQGLNDAGSAAKIFQESSNDLNEYLEMKKAQAYFHKVRSDMSALEELEFTRLGKMLLRPINRFYEEVIRFSSFLDKAINVYNLRHPDGSEDGFKKIKEDELWQRRNKAYKYLI